MKYVVELVGAAMVLIGLYGVVVPDGLVRFGRRFLGVGGVWAAFAIRALAAVAMWFAAPASATPTTFRVLAILFGVGAVMVPMIGTERLDRLVAWGAGLRSGVLRAISLAAGALGAFLLWSVLSG
ncbi:MAG: hypothetical protein R3195_10025 [Gemmatimonadota bacterium]|nr:hypothetical protein [Gemmatimonadota bacterium]